MADETSVPRVSIVIATRGNRDLFEKCIKSIEAARPTSPPLEVVVVEHQTGDAKSVLSDLGAEAVYVYAADQADKPHSYSSLNNLGASKARGDYLLLLNNDVEVRPETIREMLKVFAEHPDVGVCGAKLLFPDGLIQHMGVTINGFGVPGHFGYLKKDDDTFAPAQRSDYHDAVTFACAMIPRDLWVRLDGLDPRYFFNYEDTDFCLRAAELGKRSFVTHLAVATHHEGKSSQYRRTAEHTIKRNIAVLREIWIASGRMEKILRAVIPKDFGPLAEEKLNIAFLPIGRSAGVSWWRMHLVARKLAEKHLANVHTIYGDQEMNAVNQALGLADVAVWQGHYQEAVQRIAALGSGRGFRMVYEYDDHPIYLSPFAGVYKGLGTREFPMTLLDGSTIWLWRDGQEGFDLEKNRQNRVRQLEILSLVDAVTTTTKPLADYFRTLNPKVYMLPNCIDLSQYKAPSEVFERKDGPVRIGWWGGDNHWHDVSMIGKALTEYVNSHDVKLVLLGAFYKGPFKGIDLNKVEELDWVHVQAFPWRLAMAALDVSIVPLAPPHMPEMQFNNYKSDIKFLEGAALKWPSLVQGGVRPYESAIDGVNALTYLTDEEFTEKLDRLVKDADLRKKLASAAYDYVYEHRNLDKEIHRWLEAYTEISKAGSRVTASAPAIDQILDAGNDVQDEGAVLRAAGSNAAREGGCL